MGQFALRPALRHWAEPGLRLAGGGGGGPTYDAATVALLAAMAVQPDATRAELIDDTIIALKAAGIWDELDRLWVMAAHTEQAALLNWLNPAAGNLIAVNAPTFTVDQGHAGNGTTSYLNTQFKPSTDGVNYTLNDASFGLYSRTAVYQQSVDIGTYETLVDRRSTLALHYNTSGGNKAIGRTNQASASPLLPGNLSSIGLFVVRRAGSGAQQILKNGASLGDNTTASTALGQIGYFIAAENGNGTPSLLSTRQYAMAVVGASLSEAQQASLATILETYLDAIGAGVVA